MVKILQKVVWVLLILSVAVADDSKSADLPAKTSHTDSDDHDQKDKDQNKGTLLNSLTGALKALKDKTLPPTATEGDKKPAEHTEEKDKADDKASSTTTAHKDEEVKKNTDSKQDADATKSNNLTHDQTDTKAETQKNAKSSGELEELPSNNLTNEDLKKKMEEIKKLGDEVKSMMQRTASQVLPKDTVPEPKKQEMTAHPTQVHNSESVDKKPAIGSLDKKEQHIEPKVDKPKKSENVGLNEKFTVSDKPTSFKAGKAKPNQLFNLKIKGFNMVTVQVYDGQGNHFAAHDIPLSGQDSGCQVPIAPQLLSENFVLKVFTKHDNLMECEATIELVDYLEMDFNNNQFVVSIFAHEIHYKVKNPKKYAKQNEESRIQFIMQTSLDTQKLTGYEKVEMYINKKPVFPTHNSHELKASGSLGYGLIKSLSSRNSLYCISDNCDYYVTLYVYNVDHLYFFPTIFANNSEIAFNSYLFLIEEVEADETVTYKFKVPKSTDDWLFSLVPTEGNPDFYINPDFKPSKLSEYKYRAVGKGPENLLITHKEAESFGFTHEVFYVTYKSSVAGQAVTFRFEATKMENSKRIYVKEDHLSSGVVAKDEIVNYYLDLQNPSGDTFSVTIDLESLSGNADLYVKECAVGDTECRVKETDIVSAKNGYLTADYAGLVFRYSALEADHSSKKTDKVILNVNCHGRNGDDGFKPNPMHPTSESCQFALGVHCRDSNNKYGTLYRLVTYGNKFVEQVVVYESTAVKVLASEKLNYEVDLSYYMVTHNSYAVFKIYSLTGSVDIYFSRTNKSPNKNDFETMLQIRPQDINALTTNIFTAYIDINQELPKKALYFSVEGLEYSILDVYVDLVKDINEATSVNERLRINKMVHRGISEANHTSAGNKKVFYSSFFIDVPANMHHTKDLDISLDSDMIGLELCVQVNLTDFDPKKKCDFESSSGTLTIANDNSNLSAGKIMAISVLKYDDKAPRAVFFPINFRLMVTIDNVEKNGAELLTTGKSHSKKLNPSDSISYVLNITKMIDHGLVILTSESPSIDAVISTSPKETNSKIADLTYAKFALRINNADRFKNSHCRNSSCELYVKVTNSGLHKARFTITYTVDKTPIAITEGSHIYVPADKEQYFITKPNVFNPLSFNMATDKTASVIYAQVFNQEELRNYEITSLFSENKFDFKTHIDNENQIIVHPHVIEDRKAAAVGYLVVPKFDVSSHSNDLVVYDQADKMSISLHSTIAKLDASAQLSAHINKGDFKYYYIHIDEPKDFNIILSVHSGEADLYVNPGMYNLTTTQNYWKKRTSYKDDELLITKDMFSSPAEMVGTYTIGIYAREYSQFSIRYTQNEFAVIKLQYQRMLDVKLEKDKYYYFDFYNKHAKFNSVLYAEDSDVEVSVLNYDERNNQNFIDMIDNDLNYVQNFTFKKGDVPRKRVSEAELHEQSHYIVRMRAIERDARVTFSIYDKLKPLMTYMEKRFTFAQDTNDDQIFMIKLDASYREVDVDFKLDFGSVEFTVDDDLFFAKGMNKLEKPGQKYVKFTVDEVKKSNDIVVFKTIFIRVKAHQFSKYSIFVKPVDKFKQLRSLESELIYTNNESPQYLYYVVEKKDVKKIHSLVFDIYAVNYYAERPELLFMSDADMTLNASSPFMSMPMLDYFEDVSGRFTHLEIKPDIMPGFYVIKIPTSLVRLPIKISVSINDEKIIEPNGVFSGRLDTSTKMHKYTAYIPEAGEFRFLLESCGNVDIHNAIFTHSSNSTDMEFETRFVQAVPYLTVDKTQKNREAQYKTSAYNIRRGIVGGPGLVKFNVTSADNRAADNKKTDYFVISEFRPAHKELFLYDYVDLFNTKNETKNHRITYKFGDKRKPLVVESPIPYFRDQLLADYPNLKKIKLEFSFWLFNDDKFESELSRCGIAAVKPHDKVHHMKIRYLNKEEINKEDTFKYYFSNSDLSYFKRESQLTVFASLGISFIESEEDEQHISLNNKYASVPYFMLTFPNERVSTSNWSLFIALGAGLAVLVLLFMVFGRRYHAPEIEIRSKAGYERGTGNANKLEMTSMNRTTIED